MVTWSLNMSPSTTLSTPRADGFRMPAEWQPQQQVWMIWPERPDNWRLGGKPAQAAFCQVALAIAQYQQVSIGVSAGQYDNAQSRLSHANIRDRKSTRLNSSHVRISYAVF